MRRFLYKIIFLALVVMTQTSNAQLMPQLSQYMLNDYIINPAIGGTYDYWQIKSAYHHQWAGIADAPKTYLLGAYGPHKTQPMGYGGYIFNDVSGPISYMGVYGSYAYNIRISGDLRLSMGLALGAIQNSIDLSIIPEDEHGEIDPVVSENGNKVSKFMPDGTLGFYLYTSLYYFGFSIDHLFFNNTSVLKDYKEEFNLSDARIKPSFNLMGEYKININRNFDLYPTTMIKMAPSYDFVMDLDVRTIYQKMVWGGLGFRYSMRNVESIIIFVGYNYNDMVNIGYSYDVGISKLSSESYGSHEIMIGVKFNDIRKSRSRRKIR